MLKLLFIGDVLTQRAVTFLSKNLWSIRRREGIDFVAVNGENASFLGGISDEGAEALLSGGATHADDIAKASKRYQEVQDALDEAELRWLELSEVEG